jgi:bacterioferritin-associated ferredoxin
MYVCICNGVTDKDIQNAVKQGISSMKMLSELTSISRQCGCCKTHAHKVLQEAIMINKK